MNDILKDAIIMHKSGGETGNELNMKSTANESNQSFTILGKGKLKGQLENGKLIANGQTIIVDGKAFEPGLIPGINRIWLTCESGIFYDYTIHVNGACPKGKWDNKLQFTDESGDTYVLRIFSSDQKDHYVNYHSPAGNLVKISWDI